MTYETITFERQGPVGVLTLNRPDKLNALNQDLRQRIKDALHELAHDPSVKVAIIHGEGDKAFIAGADVSEFASRTPAEQREVYQHPRVYDVAAAFPKGEMFDVEREKKGETLAVRPGIIRAFDDR